MTDATSTTPGEVLVDVTASGGHPTALTTQGWLSDSYSPYLVSGGTITGVGNTLSTGATVAPATGYFPTAANDGRANLSTAQTLTSATTPALVAGKDNYIDWNGTDGISGLTVTAVDWNASPPSLAAGSVRLGKLVLGPVSAPAAPPTVASLSGGTIPAGTYAANFTWVGPDDMESGPASSEATITLASPGTIAVTVPSFPAGVNQARVYLRSTSDTNQHYQGAIIVSGGTLSLTSYNSTTASPPAATASSIVAGIIDLRTQLTFKNPVQGPMRDRGGQVYNVLAYGLVNDGVTDNTAALNSLIATVCQNGGGTIFFPAGRYLVLGQVYLPNTPSTAWFSKTYGSVGIRFLGVPTELSVADVAYGSILDLRWDGTTNNSAINDFAVVSGFNLQWTAGSSSGSIVADPQVSNQAWINNTSATDLTSLAAVGSFSMTGLAVSPSPNYTKYYLDVDRNGNVYATQQGQWTSTQVTGTTSVRVGGTGAGTPPSTCGGSTQTSQIDTIRTWAVYVDSNRNIAAVQDVRPFPGKIDLKPFATVVMEDLTLTRQFYGRYDATRTYVPGQYIATSVSWRCIRTTNPNISAQNPFPPRDYNNGVSTYWVRDLTFVDLVPFIRTSNTTLHLHRCQFAGPMRATNHTSPNLDAIHLGGPGGPYFAGGSQEAVSSGQEAVSSAGQFMGTGSTIIACRFQNIRRGIWSRFAGNQWTASGLYFGTNCGDDDTGGAIVFNAGEANVFSAIVEDTHYPHAICLGLGAVSNVVSGANVLDGWWVAVTGSSSDTSNSSPTSITVSTPFEDYDICAWKGKPVLVGNSTYGNAVSAITGFTLTSGGTNYAVNDSVTLSASHGGLITTVASISGGGPTGPVTGLTLKAGNNGYTVGEVLNQLSTTGGGSGLQITVTAVGGSAAELVTVDTSPFTGATPMIGGTATPTHYNSQIDWSTISLDQQITTGTTTALIGDGIAQQEMVSLTASGTTVIGGVTYYKYGCDHPLVYTHTQGELVTVSPFKIPIASPGLQYPHGGGDSVSRSLSIHHLMHGLTTTDNIGDYFNPSAAYNTILTGGSEVTAACQDDNLLPANGGTTTNTVVNSGHRNGKTVLSGNVQVVGSVATNVLSKSANYAFAPQDAVVIITAAGKTVTLPAAAVAGAGRMLTVKSSFATGSTTVRVAGGGNVEGGTTYTVGGPGSKTFISDGTNWYAL